MKKRTLWTALVLVGAIGATVWYLVQDPAAIDAGSMRLEASESASAVPSSGSAFQDCAGCPQMIPIEGGEVQLISAGANGQSSTHSVYVATAFAISKYEVTFAQYDLYAFPWIDRDRMTRGGAGSSVR